MIPAQGVAKGQACRLLLVVLALWLVVPACSPETGPDNEKLRQEIRGLKNEISALKEQVAKLQDGQQAILDLLKKSTPLPPAAVMLPPQSPLMAQPPVTPPAAGMQPITVSQLLAGKEKYLGTRVTVKGAVGPVLVHHKSLLLKSPLGMVEVFFGKIADQKLVQYLTSATLEQPVTVTGIVGPPGKTGSAKLQIDAESLDF